MVVKGQILKNVFFLSGHTVISFECMKLFIPQTHMSSRLLRRRSTHLTNAGAELADCGDAVPGRLSSGLKVGAVLRRALAATEDDLKQIWKTSLNTY